MMKDGEKLQSHCIRCGECCLSSSPGLQMADASLVYDGFIEKRNLYTIRTGEVVRDNIHGELKVTDKEIIKIREKENGRGCFYYDERVKGCAIYEYRPVQCRALACWLLFSHGFGFRPCMKQSVFWAGPYPPANQ